MTYRATKSKKHTGKILKRQQRVYTSQMEGGIEIWVVKKDVLLNYQPQRQHRSIYPCVYYYGTRFYGTNMALKNTSIDLL
jgi:hypothetical protein